MITARQSRAARALLGWTQETLADKARVSLTALKRLESDSGLEVYESTRDQVRRAFEGGGIGTLMSGDLLWVRLSDRRIDLIDKEAFLAGDIAPLAGAPFAERKELLEHRQAAIELRQRQIAACNILDNVSSAEYGAVPLAVHRRATIPWSF